MKTLVNALSSVKNFFRRANKQHPKPVLGRPHGSDDIIHSRDLRPTFRPAMLVFLVTILVGVFFIWRREHSELTPEVRTLGEMLVGCAVALALLIYEVNHSSATFSDEMSHRFDAAERSILAHLDDVVECRFLGPGVQTINRVFSRFRGARSVKNTFILFGVPEKDTYSTAQFKEANEGVLEFLNNGGTWTDILSQDVLNSPTRSWLAFLEPLTTSFSNNDEAKAALAANERYHSRCLKESYPLINFMLIDYENDKTEVLFGWGHHLRDQGGRVFVSRNPHLVATFEQYWQVLEVDSTPVEQDRRIVTPADITGLWFRVSFLVFRDWKARAGIPPCKEDGIAFHDLALARVSVADNRRLVVDGRRFRVSKDSTCPSDSPTRITRVHGYQSQAATLEGSRLWFSTTSGNDEKLHIAGWYRFVQAAQAAHAAVRINRLYGEFVEYDVAATAGTGAEFNRKVGRLVVFGVRVPRSWLTAYVKEAFNNIARKDFLTEFPDAPKDQLLLVNQCLKWWINEGRYDCRYGCVEDTLTLPVKEV